jgi:pantoate--beta-alanine ligase
VTEVVHAPSAFRAACDRARADGARLGLVPTMGALHAGHLSLVAEAKRRGCEHVAVTIFVNPLQFGPHEDFDRYPRTLDADVEGCRAAGVNTVFAPARESMFTRGYATHVDVEGLTEPLEGRFRPGHFRGVTTIVAKLFALAGPSIAIFGRKDYQQWKIVERMARDLDLPVEVIGAPIVREEDGLALSSRNRYLAPDERLAALAIVQGLRAAAKLFEGGERDGRALESAARAPVEARFDRIDYVALADPETLAELAIAPDRALLAVAAHLGKTRLIDNVVLGDPNAMVGLFPDAAP